MLYLHCPHRIMFCMMWGSQYSWTYTCSVRKGADYELRCTGEGCLRHLETLHSTGQKNKIGQNHELVWCHRLGYRVGISPPPCLSSSPPFLPLITLAFLLFLDLDQFLPASDRSCVTSTPPAPILLLPIPACLLWLSLNVTSSGSCPPCPPPPPQFFNLRQHFLSQMQVDSLPHQADGFLKPQRQLLYSFMPGT